MNEIINELVEDWGKAGINSGDMLLVHSDITRTVIRYLKQRKVRLKPEIVLESFLKLLGDSGTLLLPTFNFDFSDYGKTFDINNTPSQMGVLTEAGRMHSESVRTGHPVYSFVAIGNKSNIFKDVDNYSAYGSESPFAMLKKNNGKIAVLDLPDNSSMTFYHHIEEINNVDYRYHKSFSGKYIKDSGKKKIREYGIFVRNLERGIKTYIDPVEKSLWENKLYSGDKPGENTGLRVINSNDMFEFVTNNIIKPGNAKNNLYVIDKSN